jgi:hypothetical protein
MSSFQYPVRDGQIGDPMVCDLDSLDVSKAITGVPTHLSYFKWR